MIRRLSIALVAVVAAVALAAASSDEADGGKHYVVELRNAFGMVQDGDVRVAGSNAGKIKDIGLDERTKLALVEIEITEEGFGALRVDAECETRPQSPLGEYYMDCRAGRDPRELPEGGRIRVNRTASTIPPDLITNIMRLPYRERLRLIINEFGAGLAGRPEDLDEAIRRGVPKEAAMDFMLGHLNIEVAILFGAFPGGVFSDGAKKAIEKAKGKLFQPDWKRVFEPDEMTESVRMITRPEG